MSGEIQRQIEAGVNVVDVSVPLADRQRFLAELKRLQRRGEIGTVWQAAVQRPGLFEVTYQRIREPRSRMPLYATLTAGALGTLITVGVLAWHARHVILAGLAAALVVWWLATRSNHGGICPGLHCSGCKGWRG